MAGAAQAIAELGKAIGNLGAAAGKAAENVDALNSAQANAAAPASPSGPSSFGITGGGQNNAGGSALLSALANDLSQTKGRT